VDAVAAVAVKPGSERRPGIRTCRRTFKCNNFVWNFRARFLLYTANEGPVRIQCKKCLVLIYVFQEMKLRSLVISKT
jgi:hypothetical protein